MPSDTIVKWLKLSTKSHTFFKKTFNLLQLLQSKLKKQITLLPHQNLFLQ